MAFTFNSHFVDNAKLISELADGTKLVFSEGRFDAWCIYHLVGNTAHAIKDVEIFKLLEKHNKELERFTLYRDFLFIFNAVTKLLNYDLIEWINAASKKHDNFEEVELVLTFLYAGMIAEENKKNAILKKYIKRLGVHQVLIERLPADVAASYSKNKKWRELKLECEARGFYLKAKELKLSA